MHSKEIQAPNINRDKKSIRSELAERREAVVRALVARLERSPSENIIDAMKKDLGISRATSYRLIKTFRACGMVTSPMTRPVGRPKGLRVLDARREFLIRNTIETFYMRPTRLKFSKLVREIGRRCEEERLPAPNWRTIKARVHDAELKVPADRGRETD